MEKQSHVTKVEVFQLINQKIEEFLAAIPVQELSQEEKQRICQQISEKVLGEAVPIEELVKQEIEKDPELIPKIARVISE